MMTENCASEKPLRDPGLEADQALVRSIVNWVGRPASTVACLAGVAPTTLLRHVNGTATCRMSFATLDKLKSAFPDFPKWHGESRRPWTWDDREAAEMFGVPVTLVETWRSHWESFPYGTARQDFATLNDYLAYRAAKHKAAAERRALQRAIETNPFTLPQAIATAKAFAAAVDALPVGKDIRTRLLGHLDAHIASLEALTAPADGAAR